MKKTIYIFSYFLLVFGFFLVSLGTQAQDSLVVKRPLLATRADSLEAGWWERKTQLALNFAQASFNDSWQGGGISNIAVGGLFNNRSVYTRRKGVWTNQVQFQYGFINNRGQDIRKSVDRLFLDSQFSKFIRKDLRWFTGASFLSQFAPGFSFSTAGERQNLISSLFAPAFLSESFGLEWNPKKYLAVQLGGGTIRQTFVLNDRVLAEQLANNENRYGLAPGQRVLNELGIQGVMSFDKDVVKNVNLKIRYQVFFAYAPEAKPVDHHVNLVAAAKVNKYMNVNFSLIAIYDQDQAATLQLSQGLAAGLSFQL